jgi:hypothetical protein
VPEHGAEAIKAREEVRIINGSVDAYSQHTSGLITTNPMKIDPTYSIYAYIQYAL